MSDVHKEGCKLKWKAPEDSGGMPIDGYEVEKQDENGVWVPVGRTRDPGKLTDVILLRMKYLLPILIYILSSTEMEVTGLTPGKDYKFRVRAVNKEGESEPLETDGTITAKNPYGKFQVYRG